MGQIILILNHKGGVGKTTAAVNISHALARSGKKTLLVDSDSQCNATMMALNPATNIEPSFYHLLSDPNTSTADTIKMSLLEGVDILPNQEHTAGLELKLMGEEVSKKPEDRFLILRKRLRVYAKQQYDFTIVDLPPNIGMFVLMALNMADSVIVPIDADSVFSQRGLKNALDIILETRKTTNHDLRFLRLLVNKVDKRTSLGKIAIDHISQAFDADMICETRIPVSTHFQQAEAKHQSIFQYSHRSVGATAYTNIAEEIMKIHEVDPQMKLNDITTKA